MVNAVQSETHLMQESTHPLLLLKELVKNFTCKKFIINLISKDIIPLLQVTKFYTKQNLFSLRIQPLLPVP